MTGLPTAGIHSREPGRAGGRGIVGWDSQAVPAGVTGEEVLSVKITKGDWFAASACVVAGVAMAALPHFLAWVQTGQPNYIATNDDRYYLALASQAYFNHPGTLGDPVRVGPSTCVYWPLPYLPGVLVAKWLGVSPIHINLVWRVLSGVLAGLAWYALFRNWIIRPWVAAAVALIPLSDPGLCQGVPFLRIASRVVQITSVSTDTIFPGGGWMHLEWRILNPAATMVYLLIFILAVSRARANPTRGRIALAGMTFGLLFYVYVYYWTAAGLALCLALALDAGRRSVYFHAGWIGGAIGLPAVVSDFMLKQRLSPEVFLRTDRFLPIGRFTELDLPPELLVIAALSFCWVMCRRRDLTFVWALGFAGLLLANHQVLTGLQIENYHWSYVWGPAFLFLVVLLTAEGVGGRLNWSPRACATLIAVGTVAFGLGLWIRWVEGARSVNPIHNARVIAEYRAAFPPDHNSFTPNCVAAGVIDFVDFAAIFDNQRPLNSWSVYLSPTVDDAELDERTALNELLLGTDRAEFATKQRTFFETFAMGPCKRDPALIPARVAARLAAYDRARADLPTALDRFAVRYVALPTRTRPDYLARGWVLLANGPTWDVWERAPVTPK